MNKEGLTRREIREKALQALFPLDFNVDLNKKDAIVQALEFDHEDWISADEEEFVPEYLDFLVEGVVVKKQELDQLIQNYLKNWSVQRLAKIDLIILRIALFEMNYVSDVPGKVALNEALELTKKYSDDASRKFVNGVLSNALKDLEKE